MKVHDIISEAIPGVGTAINAVKAARSGAPAVAAAKAATKAAAAAKAAGEKIQSLDDILKMTPEELAKIEKKYLMPYVKKATDAMDYKAMDKIANALGKDPRNLYQQIAPNLIGGKTIAPEVLAGQALKTTALAGKSSDVVNIVIAMGLTKEIYTYWSRSSELDKQLAAGMSQAEYNKQLRALRGQLMTGTIVPWTAMAVLKTPTLILKIVSKLMKIVKMPNALEVISILTSRGAQLALLTWFGTDTGKNWLNDLVGGTIFGTLGRIPEMAGELYDALKIGAMVTTGIGLPKGFVPASTEIGGGSGGYIDAAKGTSREGGL